MKRSILIIILAVLTALPSFGQATKKERNLVKAGNEYFNKKQYRKAEEQYSKALEHNPNSTLAKYNLGTTLINERSNKKDKTKEDSVMTKRINALLTDVAGNPNASKDLKANANYNLGKMAYDNEDYANSVQYFKKSLKINPNDEKARKNLRMAQKKLQQQNKSQNNNDQKDKKQNQQQDQKQPPQKQPEPPKEQQQQTNNDQLLKAMQNEEKNTRDKVNRRKAQMGSQSHTSRPW